MSLFLRDKCQEKLDSVGLNNYHVRVNDSKNIYIAGECGKPLVTIEGISLSRKSPSLDEIKLATDLLDDFLSKHLILIKDYISTKNYSDSLKIPLKVNIKNSKVVKNAYYDYWILKFSPKYFKEDDEISITNEGKISVPSISFNLDEEIDVFINPILSKAELKAIKKWLKDFDEYTSAKEKENLLLQKLNSCEI